MIRIKKKSFLFYLSKETLKRSNFKNVKLAKHINIENSLYHCKKISGHYIQGHVDTTSKVISIKIIDKSWIVNFNLSRKYHKFIVEKGSICINGISLTIVNCENKLFSIALIPYTLENTTFKTMKVGDKVNIEFDIIGKYIAKMMG